MKGFLSALSLTKMIVDGVKSLFDWVKKSRLKKKVDGVSGVGVDSESEDIDKLL